MSEEPACMKLRYALYCLSVFLHVFISVPEPGGGGGGFPRLLPQPTYRIAANRLSA